MYAESWLNLPSVSSLFKIAILLIILASETAFAAENELYKNCSRTFTCANFANISYPFYGSDILAYCGHPGFQLSCNGSSPTISIMSVEYQVVEINSASKVLTIARADYLKSLCPGPAKLNSTNLNLNFFNFASDNVNVAVYYECPTITVTGLRGLSSAFTCNNHTIRLYTTPI